MVRYVVKAVFSVFFFSSRRRHTSCALVTGVQTCALPIYDNGAHRCQIIQLGVWNRDSPAKAGGTQPLPLQKPLRNHLLIKAVSSGGNLGKALKELLLAIDTQPRVERFRSEERRVGKDWVSTFRSRWSPYN